jgi:hypothetical protein
LGESIFKFTRILGENIFKFTPILRENRPQSFSNFGRKLPSNFLRFWEKISLKISLIFGENTFQNVFLTLSPIFKNNPLLLSPLRAAPVPDMLYNLNRSENHFEETKFTIENCFSKTPISGGL